MKTRSLLILCMVLVAALLCCACTTVPDSDTTPSTTEAPALTAGEIAGKMQAALQATPCSKLETVMTISLSMDAGDMGTMEMTTESITEMTISQDPVSGYSTVKTKVTYGTETTETETENYTLVEDGTLVSYVCSGGIWMKIPTGQSPEAFSNSASSAAADPDNVTVDETVTQWNGQKIICLKTNLTGDVVENAFGGMLDSISALGGALGESADTLDSVDYTGLTCSVRIYLDPETYLPLAEEMVLEGMTQVLTPLYQDMGITVEVTDCTAAGTFLSYDAQSAVTLPEGAAEKAEAWTRLLSNEPDNGDGTFTIREGTALIDVTHPEGFALVEKDYDHVTFRRDDYREITYLMSYVTGEETPGTGESFLATNDKAVSRWTTGGGTVNRQQIPLTTDTLTFTCDLLATTWGTGREDANFSAWATLGSDGTGTYYLYIEISDGYNDGMGFSKSADITSDEFAAYLNAASPSKLTAE